MCVCELLYLPSELTIYYVNISFVSSNKFCLREGQFCLMFIFMLIQPFLVSVWMGYLFHPLTCSLFGSHPSVLSFLCFLLSVPPLLPYFLGAEAGAQDTGWASQTWTLLPAAALCGGEGSARPPLSLGFLAVPTRGQACPLTEPVSCVPGTTHAAPLAS